MIFLGITHSGKAVFQIEGDLMVTTSEDEYDGVRLPPELSRHNGSLLLLVEGDSSE